MCRFANVGLAALTGPFDDVEYRSPRGGAPHRFRTMAFATSVHTPIVPRLDRFKYSASPCDNSHKQWWDVLSRPEQDICLEEGEFQLNGPHGQRRIARFTGRKRWVNANTYAPTLEVFDVDTVVEMVGDLPVLVGRRGERIKGTWWTSPNACAQR